MIEESHDAHVQAATKEFRSCGFTLAAMQFPRSEASLAALKRFNGLPDDAKVPFAWGFHSSEWMRDNWRSVFPAHCVPESTSEAV